MRSLAPTCVEHGAWLDRLEVEAALAAKDAQLLAAEARQRELKDGIIDALKMLHPTPTSFIAPDAIERLRHALHGIAKSASPAGVDPCPKCGSVACAEDKLLPELPDILSLDNPHRE